MHECKSLSSYLWQYNLKREKLKILLCKSDRTLRYWEKSPPQYVINIIKEIGNKQTIPESWLGWYFENNFLFDDSGNGFNKDEIRAIFFTRQLTNNLIGNQSNVLSLKNSLEDKEKLLNSEILIQLVNSGETLKEVKISI